MYTHTYKHQPHIRQEGFSVDPTTHPAGQDYPNDPMDFNSMARMDFTDELASLMGAASPPHHTQQQSNERSTQSPDPGSYKTHNIFDMSATTAAPTTNNFNSTVPALNSSMRFEPHGSNEGWRHTPSPIEGRSESRSRSRPPGGASGAGPANGGGGNVGPTRTTRTRRGSSAAGEYGRPNAIVIPGSRPNHHGLSSPLSSSAATTSGSWLGPASPASEFTLPTPDSLHHHGHHSLHSLHNHNSFGGYNGNAPGTNGYGSYNQSNTGANGYFNGNGAGMSPQTEYHLTTPSTSLPVTGNIHQHLGGHHHHTRSTSASNAPTVQTPTNAISANQTPTSATNISPAEKQAIVASEKRRRRRESHNAVERRRRDNINEKISELATLIPEDMLEGGIPSLSGSSAPPPIAPSTAGGDSPTSPGGDLLSPIDGTDSHLWPEPKKEESLGMFGEDILGSATSPTATTNSNGSGNGNANNAGGVVKANKGMILRRSVEYIRYLQQLVQTQNTRNRQLEAELAHYRPGHGSPGDEFLFNPPSAGGGYGVEGAGYGGSYRILDSMPEEAPPPTNTISGTNDGKAGDVGVGMVSPVSQPASGSTPSSPEDDDSEYEEKETSKKKVVARGRRPASGRTPAKRKGAKAKDGEDVDMGGSDAEEIMQE
ncbi:hypothetical protein VNI00_010504 [Paramarasmius palmivorus]|uniref:BHLH domain-containing protein n=1 Tax=Paramarasmius palmivorus TaxID=297713 RepID=A0AAW0CIT1_9AGAR